MRALIYDLEIVKAIPDKKKPPLPGIEYCEGWNDHAGMGISVLCAYDSVEKRMRVFCEDNRDEFVELANERWPLVSFNGLSFDNRVIQAAWDFTIVSASCYDLLAEVWRASGLAPEFRFPTHMGYGLGACCEANGIQRKTGHGALAPIDWQRGKIGKVIDYCVNDVLMTWQLWQKAMQGPIVSPKNGAKIQLRHPEVEV